MPAQYKYTQVDMNSCRFWTSIKYGLVHVGKQIETWSKVGQIEWTIKGDLKVTKWVMWTKQGVNEYNTDLKA